MRVKRNVLGRSRCLIIFLCVNFLQFPIQTNYASIIISDINDLEDSLRRLKLKYIISQIEQ